jgi:hypothetical protein
MQSDNYVDLVVLGKTETGRAFIYNNECLLMQISVDTTQRVIFLADKSNGKIFARYYDYRMH